MTSRAYIAQQVSASLQHGCTVIASNQRAARTLTTHAMATGEVFAWSAWISKIWTALLIDGLVEHIVLRPSQELRLWEDIIRDDHDSLLTADSFARMEMEANILLHTWKVRLSHRHSTHDTATFARHVETFQKRCQQHGWISAPEIAGRLTTAVQQGLWEQRPQAIALVGFDRMSAAQRDFFAALQQAGTHLHLIASPPLANTLQIAACEDEEDAFQQCALWVQQYHQRNPQARIAIVNADIASIRTSLDRALREHVAPSMHHIESHADEAPWEFALGTTLDKAMMTQQALWLLQWTHHPLSLDRISNLLCSPYLGTSEDVLLRAEWDAFFFRNRNHLSSDCSMEVTIAWLSQEKNPTSLKRLAQHLRDMAARLDVPDTAPWSAWSELFASSLKEAGWSLGRALDSAEYQLKRRWDDLLDELSALELLEDRASFQDALRMLQSMASTALFAPESHNAPIQIVSPLESSGSEFDAIWFLQADDQHWPTTSHAHPLLPYQAQQEAGVPGADVEQDYLFGVTLSQRLMHSATDVVISYAKQSAAGEETRLSSLFREVQSQYLPLPCTEPQIVHLVEEDDWQPLPALPSSHVAGGATVLEAMAACPFRAFAERRLFATEPDEVDHGLNPIERGNMVHRVLQSFWQTTKTHAALKSLSWTTSQTAGKSERDLLLEELIQQAMPTHGRSLWEKTYLQLEAERVYHLLTAWLDLEMEREPFEVESTEHEVPAASIGPLHLTLRVDRIDKVPLAYGEGRLLIDYKTGIHHAGKDWFGERPDKPQLPLYAVAAHLEEVCGIAYAGVRSGEKALMLTGISSPDTLVKHTKHPSSYPEALQQWQQSLPDLATQFANGTAAVDPKHRTLTCMHCKQRLLCRIRPASEEHMEIEEAGAEG